MAHRAIREADAKRLLSRSLKAQGFFKEYLRSIGVDASTDLETLPRSYPWLAGGHLVVKPDMLFGKRGKKNMVQLDISWTDAKKFLKANIGKKEKVDGKEGKLDHWIVEPFVPHKEEFYLSIRASNGSDTLMFSPMGGINIESNKDSVKTMEVPVGEGFDVETLKEKLLVGVKDKVLKEHLADFIMHVNKFFVDYDLVSLEMNPFTYTQEKTLRPLDLRVVLDDTAAFQQQANWGKDFSFPEAFGTVKGKEEQYIAELDAKTGASLKLKILNPEGRIWTMVAGGGASVIYADTIADLGHADEMANYGEYSGNPNREMTREYARTILEAMTRNPDKKGRPKILLIGGGVANFTDVAKTFDGIIDAIREYKTAIQKSKVKIFVRRGGPNYKEGLRMMRNLGEELKIPIEVYGPETHMTYIVRKALEQ